MNLNPQQARSLVAICLHAAFADGHQGAEERDQVRKVAESLGREAEIDFIALYQDVLLGRLELEAAVAGLDEANLRQLAFERVPRPGLLADRCVTDPDPALRRWLLDRIEDISTLERIAERARKSDKLLSRTARERVQAARLAAGDPAATAERALAICEELDSLRRTAAPGAPAPTMALPSISRA